MKIITKKIVVAVVGLSILGILLFWLAQMRVNDNVEGSRLETQPRDYTRTGLIEYITKTKGNKYERYSLTENGPKNLIITYYQNERGSTFAERDREGILVFQDQPSGEAKLLWESSEKISATLPIIGAYDLTGDGVKEILALWQYDLGEDLYIYKWDGGNFKMITPYLDSKSPYGKGSKYLGFGGDGGATKIFDVDKDGIPEIVFPYILEKKTRGIVYHAYKWSGSKYFLWKEQKESFTPHEGEDEYSVISILQKLETESK